MADRTAEVMHQLAESLTRLRRQANLTQAELAKQAGVTVETVARLERVVRGRSSANGNPSLDTLVRLADALGLELVQLLGEPNKPAPRAWKAERMAWRIAEATRLEREAERLRSGR